jgi:LA2681-like HEPN
MASESKLRELADAINVATDRGDLDALERLDVDIVAVEPQLLPGEAAMLLYFRSNVHAALQDLKDPRSWNWRQPHRERQILYLRRARSHSGFHTLHRVIKTQTATNLANSLNTLGRSVEALEFYDEALTTQPRFAMALGNRGLARSIFATSLHDHGQSEIILVAAYDDLVAACSDAALWEDAYPQARDKFQSRANAIAKLFRGKPVRASVELDGHSLGRSSAEKSYRSWCLRHRLFMNPLNVLGARSIAATDHFGLPDHQAKLKEPPQFIAWFNQLKQEFAAARLLCFESETDRRVHFSDRRLSLVDTLDYAAFGLSIEKLRLSFRSAYSLLDKIAGFVNAYFDLRVPERKVNIRSIWRKGKERLRPDLAKKSNLYLRGLYWLAMDIVDETPEDQDSLAPQAAHLRDLRNSLEHRCVVLRDLSSDRSMGIVATATVREFRAQTMELLKLVQAALIYLSLAVAREEHVRHQGESKLLAPMWLPTYDPRLRAGL